MSLNNLTVSSIEHFECREWLLYKHYAKRMPSISYSYGLFDGLDLIGICTIGKPASPSLCVGVCGKEQSEYVYELNRLVVNDDLPSNALSYFVGKVLKLLPPMILVSYADTSQNHHGYIYQATNWIYTGATKERTDIGFEDGTHSRHYDKKIDKSLFRKKRSSKHRYIYFIGTKRDKKIWRSLLRYDAEEYPKGDNQRYDASYKPNTQRRLF
jgi:hypothetical protein